MSNTIIKVENLSKKYIIGHQQEGRGYIALRDVLANGIKTAIKKLTRPPDNKNPALEDFWALKDVSFEIKEGDRVGIIGRNGAGKSTLLKILSHITEPTMGKVKIKGRVASLLEVGTGFHPELTGRENIYLNGAILGMTKAEIKKKFDKIVDFAEIEKFLDTPVKRYSSGMYVRLAFAVAAHLEPEILLVDEVLAVGDIQFQNKCLGKMKDMHKQDRTLLFVSHNMNAVEQICDNILLLDKGEIKLFSKDVKPSIKTYLFSEDANNKSNIWINSGNEYNNPWFKPLKFFIGNEDGKEHHMPVNNNENIWVIIEGEINELNPSLVVGYEISTEDGVILYSSYQTDSEIDKWPKLKTGNIRLFSRISKRFLNEGIYKLELSSALNLKEWLCEPRINAPVIYLSIQGLLSESPYWTKKREGVISPLIEWLLK